MQNTKEANTTRAVPKIPVYSQTPESQQELLNYLINAGTQAPSWYNSQPWQFIINDNQVQVFLNPEADQSLYDCNNINSTIACAGVLENIMIAAESRDLSPQLDVLPDASSPYLVGSITLDFNSKAKTSKPVDLALERSIWLRHTNTLLYKNDQLTNQQSTALLEAGNSDKDTALYLLGSDEDKQNIFNANSKAESIRFSRQDLHEQLVRMIRWTDVQAQADKTGYTLASMGLCGFGKHFFQMTRSWHLMQLLNIFGMASNLAQRACEGLTHCSAIGLITVKGYKTQDLIDGGRAMERVWLTANKLGLDLHPHNSLILFDWIQKNAKTSPFVEDESNTITQAMRILFRSFSEVNLHHQKEVGVFLFRVGVGDNVKGYSLRDTAYIKT